MPGLCFCTLPAPLTPGLHSQRSWTSRPEPCRASGQRAWRSLWGRLARVGRPHGPTCLRRSQRCGLPAPGDHGSCAGLPRVDTRTKRRAEPPKQPRPSRATCDVRSRCRPSSACSIRWRGRAGHRPPCRGRCAWPDRFRDSPASGAGCSYRSALRRNQR